MYTKSSILIKDLNNDDFTPSDNLDDPIAIGGQNEEIQARLVLGSAMTSSCNFQQTETDFEKEFIHEDSAVAK